MSAPLFISAGELSGELHAARLVHALRALRPELEYEGFGGRTLEAAGVRLLFPLSDYAVMGFKAVLKDLGRFVDVLARFDRHLEERRPRAVVLVDYPGLHLRMARLAHDRGIPVIYFICPQLWAWAPWRARRFARNVDLALTILPFEEEYFRRLGIEARFIGHPSADADAASAARAAPGGSVAAPHPAPARPIGDAADEALTAEVRRARPGIALLPGSRRQEVRTNLPLLLEVARSLRAREPEAAFFLPQFSERARSLCADVLASAPDPRVALVDRVEPVLRGARFALVASGTATFEVARHGVPMVVVYRVKPMHRLLGGLFLTVPWISQVNLIAGAEIVPEFVSADPIAVAAPRIAEASLELIADGEARTRCVDALRTRLAPALRPGASKNAARALAAFLDRHP